MPHESTFVRRAYDYLKLHGWRIVEPDLIRKYFTDDDDSNGLWIPPSSRPLSPSEPPPHAYATERATRLQLQMDRARLLMAEGWEEESGIGTGDLVLVDRMRSAIDFKPNRKRIIGTLQLAMRYQREKGWTALSDAPDMPAIWDRHQLVVPVWCPYCEEWHVHATARCDPDVGDRLPYVDAGCEGKTPYTNVGYRPVVQYVTPPFVSAE